MNKMSLHCHIPLVIATAHARKESSNPYIELLCDSCSQSRSMSPFSFFKCYFHTYAKGQKVFSLTMTKIFPGIYISLLSYMLCMYNLY